MERVARGGRGGSDGEIHCVPIVSGEGTNDDYISNRVPLAPSPLIALPVGAVKPGGWLGAWLALERDGMVGRLEEVSPWVQPEDHAWLDPDGEGAEWVYERVPYWLRGYGDLGYILDDEELIHKADAWREATLAHQGGDGDFGPARERANHDLWPRMVMLDFLQSHHEITADERVIPFLLRFFHFVDSIPENDLLGAQPQWLAPRGGDLFFAIIWAYNRTGENWLLELARKVHRNTADWASGMKDEYTAGYLKYGFAHCVNWAQGFREPAQYYQLALDPELLRVTEQMWQKVKGEFGQFAGGMYAGDERMRRGYVDPSQGIETCAMVEFMRSAEILVAITGDPIWADRCEDVAFNSLPAALMPDFRGLHYLTCANCTQLDHADREPKFETHGCRLSYSPHARYHCCQHNVSMGWPYFSKHLWYATKGNGLAAVLYAESEINAKVGDGVDVRIREETSYPFEDTIRFTLETGEAVVFPWMLRIPGWCVDPVLLINGREAETHCEPGSFVAVRRRWENGDNVELRLPMKLSLTTWEGNADSVSVNYGPLSFSLKMAERWQKYEGHDDNQGTEEWPEWQVFPESPWNYALVLNPEDRLAGFEVSVGSTGQGQVFTSERAPVEIRARARRLPTWEAESGTVGLVPQSPVETEDPVETITLIPMGCARLRITSFPWVAAPPS